MDQIERERALALYRQLLQAWNKRDADEFAAAFAENGSAVGFDGSALDGPAEIATALRAVFGNHQTATYVAKVREVRELGPGNVLIRAVAGMVPPGGAELNPAVNAIQSLVVIAHGAEVSVALLQNTPAAFHGRPQAAEQLTRELTEVLRSGQTLATG